MEDLVFDRLVLHRSKWKNNNTDRRSTLSTTSSIVLAGSPRKSKCHRLSAMNHHHHHHHPGKKLIKISEKKKTPIVHIKSFNLVRRIVAVAAITSITQNRCCWVVMAILRNIHVYFLSLYALFKKKRETIMRINGDKINKLRFVSGLLHLTIPFIGANKHNNNTKRKKNETIDGRH